MMQCFATGATLKVHARAIPMSLLILAGMFWHDRLVVGPDPATPAVRACPMDRNGLPRAGVFASCGPGLAGQQRHHRAAGTSSAYWKKFNDPELDSLIDRAARQNLNVRYATAQIRAARATRGLAASALLSSLSQAASYKRSFSGQRNRHQRRQ